MAVFTPISIEKALTMINRWFDETAQRYTTDQSTEQKHTSNADNPLRAADIELMLNCEQRRVTIENISLDFRDDDSSDDTDPDEWYGALDPEQINTDWLPVLKAHVQQRLKLLLETTLFSYYHFRLEARFATRGGLVHSVLLDHVNELKKQQLLQAMAHYRQHVLEQASPTDATSTLFFCSNALNRDLYPQPDIADLLHCCNRIQLINQGQAELAEHRHWIVHLLTKWVEQQFLPRYFDVKQQRWQGKSYQLKVGVQLEPLQDGSTHPIEVLLYVAVMILRFEPSYSKSTGLNFLELSQQLGCDKAGRLLKEGSGAYAPDVISLKNAELQCSANDVLAVINIQIKQETAIAYQQAVEFVIRLLGQGFPKNYKIKLKSTAKNYLPVKGLARSDTHRFFANALHYPALHPLLEQYARTAIQQYEWYADTDAEKSCMPGSYAVFGLALHSEQYFPLLKYYMSQLDEEHQLVQDAFIQAFVTQYGLTAISVPVLIYCLRYATESLKLKLQPQLEDDATLHLVAAQFTGLPDYTAEHILYLLWGKLDKIEKLAKKASAEKQSLFQLMLQAAGRS